MMMFLIFAGLLAARFVIEIIINPRIKADSKFRADEAVSLAVLTLSHMLAALAAGYYLFVTRSVSPVLFAVGCALFVIGFAGRIAGLLRLGKSYSQKIDALEGSALVTSGIYSVIRHPLYFFYTLEMVGFLLIRANIISLTMLMLELAAVSYRITGEEKTLAEKFGEAHRAYRGRTKRFIPYLY